MIYTHTGNCPRCGAPVYAVIARASNAPLPPLSVSQNDPAPVVHYTCRCHEVLPDMKPLTGEPDETVDEADRKHLAKHRPGERDERPSVERAD